MKSFSIEELKMFQLEMLKKIADYCESSNLTYFLAYGTLLGAVRHKGYIPWDDDIDIIMPRRDYNLFLEHFNGQVPNLVVAAPEIDIEYYAPYANVYDNRTVLIEEIVSHGKLELGVKIDIFPLDFVPSDEKLYDEIWRCSLADKRSLFIKTKKLSFCHGIERIKLALRKIQFSFLSLKKIQERHLKLINNTKYKSDGPLVDVITMPWGRKLAMPQDYFFPVTKLLFEGYEFNAPNDSDKILQTLYGDYMKLPPVSERVAKHSFIEYWK